MTQEEAFQIIKTEYPEFENQAKSDMENGVDLTEFLSTLYSFY